MAAIGSQMLELDDKNAPGDKALYSRVFATAIFDPNK